MFTDRVWVCINCGEEYGEPPAVCACGHFEFEEITNA